ncbi:class I SAM-dependent methyltransferase [Paucibacter sp. DJ1R-11]|uniref:class I SAM-dependent methyltransferase n=1 Tax=Paucibacter sp. DJ1R-11 TaxID=2893556 RepID=UPI0021E36709|nr:class I SAM-dependent methyltransferase [Paucibacter sp. DJ1R-11]MCV2366050.1 class I SAM-dependent methyltransferase [Paucibacter sp. DJ1R-11]
MKLATLKKLVFEKNVLSFLRLGGETQSLYRSAFASAADASGLLTLLQESPRDSHSIAQALRIGPERHNALLAWLDCGLGVGELALRGGRYHLKGKLSRLLARPRNDVTAAMFAEVTRYHFDAILGAPARLRGGRTYTLDDQDGALIARSSRILEPFVEEAIDWAFTQQRPRSVLEVGCGAGHYLSYMLKRWPGVQLTAIDMQADVVDSARAHLNAAGLKDQVDLQQAQLFDLPPPPPGQGYELITLHNNFYYFKSSERQALLEHVGRLLAPDGRVLITSSCQGGSPAVAALHLWWTLSDINAGLPERAQLLTLLQDTGWRDIAHRQLLPGESYYGFLARRPNPTL